MTKDEITRMAREAFGFPYSSYLEERRWDISNKQLERFAALAIAAEREACAKVCESLFDLNDDSCNEAEKCAAAIRARGEK